jgi:hypothetical protein
MENVNNGNNTEDADKLQGAERKVGYRSRILWGCACSYLLPAILLIVYIIVRWRYHMPIIPWLK